jgi:hypothetical protein
MLLTIEMMAIWGVKPGATLFLSSYPARYMLLTEFLRSENNRSAQSNVVILQNREFAHTCYKPAREVWQTRTRRRVTQTNRVPQPL